MLIVNPAFGSVRSDVSDEEYEASIENLDNTEYDDTESYADSSADCSYDNEPEPFIYRDEEETHSAAVNGMLEIVKNNGIRTLYQGDEDITPDRDYQELLNPSLALPAAYTLAKNIYDIERSELPANISEDERVRLSIQESDKVENLHQRLDKIIDESLIGDPENGTDLLMVSGERSLTHAFHDKIDQLREQDITDQESGESPEVEQEDITVICEALGQLCEEELAARKGQKRQSWRETVRQKALPSPTIDISIIDPESELAEELADYKVANQQINIMNDNIEIVRGILAKHDVVKADIIPATTQVDDANEVPIAIHLTLSPNASDVNQASIKQELKEELGVSVTICESMDPVDKHILTNDSKKQHSEQKSMSVYDG